MKRFYVKFLIAILITGIVGISFDTATSCISVVVFPIVPP